MLCIVKGVILFRSDRPFSLLLLQLVSASFARPREKIGQPEHLGTPRLRQYCIAMTTLGYLPVS